MNVEVYADGSLIYSPGLTDFELLGLTVTTNVDKAGTAVITLPPDHPAYDAFISYRTVVTIYREGVLLFRGRALYPEDDFYGRRKITCEGERCFLQDGVMRPHSVTGSPEAVFMHVMAQYNAQVDDFKQFRVGEVTVTDPNDYIYIESEDAEQIADTVDKLVKRCGGYIVFTADTDGARVINWLADLERQSGQSIEFGENLLDFSSSGANTELATAIVPYGKKNEETGKYVTIESVNNGLDYIQDDAAVALRGFIALPVYWDDVTKPANLLKKAQQYLASSKLIITSLELSAVDLSVLDSSIDTFQVGDWVRVYSAMHNVDEDFMLRTRTYDLLNPSKDKVTFGKELATLTGADVSRAKANAAKLQQTAQNVRTDMSKALAAMGSKVNSADAAAGQYMTSDGLLMQWGSAAVTPGTAAEVVFECPYAAVPVVTLTPVAADPTGLAASISASSETGASIMVASSGTDAVTVYWFAIGRGA